MNGHDSICYSAVVSHKGCVRGNNEDNFVFNGDYMPLGQINEGAVIQETFKDNCQLYVVADGMGGGDLGERASTIAVQMMNDSFEKLRRADIESYLNSYIRMINRTICEERSRNGSDVEGTTLAALILQNGCAFSVNVGDSRIYLLRDQALQMLSMDHSSVWEQYMAGKLTIEQARKSPNNNMITHYIGEDESEIDKDYIYINRLKMRANDRYMICSDGLSDLVSNTRIETVMRAFKDPLRCAKELVMLALEEGGKDNVTCIVVDVVENEHEVDYAVTSRMNDELQTDGNSHITLRM